MTMYSTFFFTSFLPWLTYAQVGQSVLVLRGRAKGLEAELLAIHEDRYCCDVRVTQRGSELCGQELRGLEYEHVCKYSP